MTHSALTLAQRLHGLLGFNEASHFACTAVSVMLSSILVRVTFCCLHSVQAILHRLGRGLHGGC